MSRQQEEQDLAKQLRGLQQALPDLVEDPPTIAEPTVEKPFSIPPRQRMDPMDITREQIRCAKIAIKERKAKRAGGSTISMKKGIKQVGGKFFSYTYEKELYVLNDGKPLRGTMTCYNSLAVFNVSIQDRRALNEKIEAMARSSRMTGSVKLLNTDADETVFVKMDSMTQLFDEEKKPLTNIPKSKAMNWKLCVRLIGVMKHENLIYPMMRLHQAKVEPMESMMLAKTNTEPCMFN